MFNVMVVDRHILCPFTLVFERILVQSPESLLLSEALQESTIL